MKAIQERVITLKSGKVITVYETVDTETGKVVLSEKKRLRRDKRDPIKSIKGSKRQQTLIAREFRDRPKSGYLHHYVAEITDADIQFAKLNQLKLVSDISVYSANNDHLDIDKALSDKTHWPHDHELKYLTYKFVETSEIEGKLKDIRKSNHWGIERCSKDSAIKLEDGFTYICSTTANYLTYLSKKYGIQAWVFTRHPRLGIVPNERCFKGSKIAHYKTLIKKGKVLIKDSFLANQILRLTKEKDLYYECLYVDTVGYKQYEHLIRKPVTNYSRDRKTIDPLVCITDGTTVSRILKSKAVELIKQFPTMKYCKKQEYHKFLHQFEVKKPKFRDEKAKRVPVLSTQNEKGTRKDRRIAIQKRRLFSRLYTKQYISGKWIDDPNNPEMEILDTSFAKTIIVKKSVIHCKNSYLRSAKLKRVLQPKFETVEVDAKRIKISKFPYGQEMAIQYKKKDGETVSHPIAQGVKMIGKKLILEDAATKESTVICAIKDVEKWCHQKDYSTEEGKTDWIPYVTIEPFKRTKHVRIEFHLPEKTKKAKQWKHPVDGSKKKILTIRTPKRSGGVAKRLARIEGIKHTTMFFDKV
jgi:hypothetical protein